MSKSKIFNIGFNKSGSTSLTKAMRILGYKGIRYWYNGKRIIDLVKENSKNNKILLDGLEQFDFISDFSGHIFLKELDEQYPGSKFILTIRELRSWLKSRERHVKRNQKNPDYKYDFIKVDKTAWKKERDNVLSKLNRYFKDRPDDLLIIDICGGDGWEKLCEFLNLPFPDQLFPRENITPGKYLFQPLLERLLNRRTIKND